MKNSPDVKMDLQIAISVSVRKMIASAIYAQL